MRGAGVEVLTPLFRALVDAAEAQLLKMHAEDYNTAPRAGLAAKPGASATMQGLVRLLAQWRCVIGGPLGCHIIGWAFFVFGLPLVSLHSACLFLLLLVLLLALSFSLSLFLSLSFSLSHSPSLILPLSFSLSLSISVSFYLSLFLSLSLLSHSLPFGCDWFPSITGFLQSLVSFNHWFPSITGFA